MSLGDGDRMKGRRLFGGDESAGTDGPSDLSSSERFSLSTGRTSSEGSFSVPTADLHSSVFEYTPFAEEVGVGPFDKVAASASLGIAPGTPSRNRQPSFGTNGGGWDAYLNASPSPGRSGTAAFAVPLGSLPGTSVPLGGNGAW